MLESKYGSPKIVNDGVTVAKEVELEDPVENIGAKLVRQVCRPGCLTTTHGCGRGKHCGRHQRSTGRLQRLLVGLVRQAAPLCSTRE